MHKKEDGRVQFQMRLDPDLRRRLERESRRRMVSKTLLANQALREALDRWEEDDLVASNS